MSNNYSLLIKLLMNETLQGIIYTYNINEACERQSDRQTDRQRERERQTEGETDRQTDRQTETETDREAPVL